MRYCLAIAAIFFVCLQGFSQAFNGGGGAIPGSSTTPTCFNINVTGVGVINTTTRGLASVCMNITHGDVGDLEITLTGPDGTMIPLSIQNGGTGNNYTNTCFTATAAGSIKFANPPYTGNFLPEGWLGAVNNGQSANGTWRLCIRDRRNPGSSGSLVNWSLNFNTTPAPMPPPIPACANTLPANSSCSNATLVCDFNGQCGNTSGNSIQDWPGSGLDGSCFGLNNNSFIRFVASATIATFSVWVPTTVQTNQQGGVQMLFFSGTCNSGPVTVHGCYPRILPYSSSGQPLVSVVTANNLIPGNTYYLMIDGANGDITTFTIAANTGVNVLNINPPAPDICAGQSVNLTASGGNGIYNWSPATNLSSTSGSTVTANPGGTTTYTVTSTTPTGCPLTKDVTVTVNPLPVAPAATVTQPTCTTPTGTITITAPVGAGLQYSINGGTYQSSTTFTGLAPNIYNVTIQNAAGCTSTAASFTVNAAPTPPVAPTATITQPTCTTPTGTITIAAPTGAGLQYSINGGPYQSSTTFTGLAPNIYNVTVQNAAGCTSTAASFTVNAAPTPPVAPTATITQPTCTTPTGTITITAPTGTGLQYSINGGPYQSSTTFTGLTPNIYNVTVQNAAGCTSTAASFTVNAAPNSQQGPLNITTVHPGCGETTGRIVITPPAGSNLEFSINGTSYQASPSFNNVAPGDYNVTVRNTVTGCVSTATTTTVNPPPTLPGVPVGSVTTQPDCENEGGTITITSPAGNNYQYSINGGTQYQVSPVFTNLAPNTYTIIVRNTVSGCLSQPLVLTVNNGPVRPAQPTLNTVQPPCGATVGSITITAPLGTGFQFSLDGNVYQSSPVFNNLPEGIYLARVKDASGCISHITTAIILVAGVPPAAPITTTLQPNCARPTGTITVTSPIGSNLQYNINGGTYQTSPVFQGLAPGSYDVRARTVSGCVSSITSVTINVAQTEPTKPVLFQTQPSCPARVGEIRVDAPFGPDLEYSLNGGTYQVSNTFPGLAGGNYTVTARFAGTNCISQPTSVVIFTLTPDQCVLPGGGDIYFPTAFTPNGDGLNDGFGPGPRSSLAGISEYSLHVYNRYGEMVFRSSNPLQQWDGRYKGKMLGNNSYSWVAQYRFNGRPPVIEKGTLILIR